jgi:hypothetical protein
MIKQASAFLSVDPPVKQVARVVPCERATRLSLSNYSAGG